MDSFPHRIIGLGAVLLAFTSAIGWGGLNTIINGQLRQRAKLVNTTDNWKEWEKHPEAIFFKVHLFNVDNPEAVVKGEKPKVTEMGPYVYREWRHKVDIETETKENDTVMYRQVKRYEFIPRMSKGTEADMVTILNMPYLGIATMATEVSTEQEKVTRIVNSILTQKDEQIFVTHPVKELLFDTYDAHPYVLIYENEDLLEVDNFTVPEAFADGRWGILKNRNGGDDGIWEIKAGRLNESSYGRLCSWNGMEYLTFWKDDHCNSIRNRTDGLLFAPPLSKSSVLQVYYPEICKSKELIFEREVAVKGVSSLRFRHSNRYNMSPAHNENNWCFCPYDSTADCDLDGIEYLSPCNEGLPLLSSQPHFLGADENVFKSVEGLEPSLDKHGSFLDIHWISAIVMQSRKRWQISMHLTQLPGMEAFQQVPDAFIPIAWIEEAIDVSDKKVNMLIFRRELLKGWKKLRWGMLATAAAIIFGGLVIALTRKGGSKVEQITLLQ